jgi:cytochrome c
MRGFVAGCGVVALALISFGLVSIGAQEDAGRPEFYTAKVRPILTANCGSCHMGMAHKGDLSLQTRESTLKGGQDGAVIVPGDPANSLLVKLIRHEGPPDDPMPMPMNKPRLSDAEIAIITAWIKAGAAMPGAQ